MKAKHSKIRSIIHVLLTILVCVPYTVSALIQDLQVSADRSEFEIGTTTIINVTWRGTTTNNQEGSMFVSSAEGQFVTERGTVLATVPQRYSERIINQSLDNRTPFIFRESVVIDPALSATLASAGGGRVRYQRAFEDDGVAVTASLELSVPQTTQGTLNIEAMELRFDDRSRVRVIPEHSPLSAYGRFRFAGSGLVEFRWEIADPSSTSGTPIYRAIAVERQYLSRLGQVTVTSPKLPNFTNGWFSLRLIASGQGLDVRVSTINYYVVSTTATNKDSPLATILLDTTGLSTDRKSTQFGWTAVPNAVGYKLELLQRTMDTSVLKKTKNTLLDPKFLISERVISHQDHSKMEVIAAMYLAATSQPRTSLTALMQGKLGTSARYQWRILAFSEQGRLIAASALTNIHFVR